MMFCFASYYVFVSMQVNTVLLVVVMRSLCRSNMGKSKEEISTDDSKQDRENAL